MMKESSIKLVILYVPDFIVCYDKGGFKMNYFNSNSMKHRVIRRLIQLLKIEEDRNFYSNGGTVTLPALMSILRRIENERRL